MGRFTRKSLILAKVETTPGTEAAPDASTDAILVSNLNVNPLNAQNIDRALIRTYFGASEQLVGDRYLEISFDVEIAGAGTAGAVPAWGKLLRACGFGEDDAPEDRVEYTPITDSIPSLTFNVHSDGLLHKGFMGRGDVTFNMNISERPVMSFRFLALDGGTSATSNPNPTLTAWQKPLVITDANTGDITLGCTYATGAISGGTAYPSRGMTVALGNAVNHLPMLGGESVDISDRQASGSIQLDLTAAQENTFMTNVKANLTQSIGFLHGTTAGNRVLFFMPTVQLINPSKQDVQGRLLIGFDMRVVPGTGNDEIRIVSL
jgi:hypothetical protein